MGEGFWCEQGRVAAGSRAEVGTVVHGFLLHQDIKAHTSIPLLGYQVIAGPQGDPRVFQLHQSGQMYTFKAESEELQGRWVRAIKRAANGWTPEEPDEEDMSD